ncbi:MAG: T9SS type A sorting domain-containing protein, partial [Calditrichaeota bacterium]|nr:T9SS type A sorting domain-containing protein [Calditrichota bacterium]
TWTALDWYGWRLVEWDLGDPNSVGNWIGDGIVEGTLRFDSFQLAYDPGFSAVSGRIYFDNIRLVKKTTDPVAVTVLDNAVPESFRLYQNYPNPFNPATTIAFDLPESGKVKLTVFDVLGREVKTLLNGRRNAGSYEVSFDASDLASGVYIYRLSTQQRALARRMLLVK